MSEETPEIGKKSGDRDAKGRFIPGHSVQPPPGLVGRPRLEDAEKLRAALSKVVDNGTMKKWAEAMKRRIERGDMAATEFVFERVMGKVPQALEHGIDDRLAEFIACMMTPDDGGPGDS